MQALSLKVTSEQKELIYAMWAHNGWEVELADPICEQCLTGSQDESHVQPEQFVIESREGEIECEYCFCCPCVTSEDNRQFWWEVENSNPQGENSQRRKHHYKRFWVMLLHRNIWNDPRYLERKAQALGLNGNVQDCAWSGPSRHRRDIMPACVLKLVRSWLPNPVSRPYLGHQWQ
jgi:hypothetical protein